MSKPKTKLKHPEYEKACKILGLSYISFDILFHLQGSQEGLSAKTISEECGFSLQSTQRAVREMVKKGLLDREQKWHSKGGKVFYKYYISKGDLGKKIESILNLKLNEDKASFETLVGRTGSD